MKIESNSNGPFAIEVKRFYLPFTLTTNCPECGEEVTTNLEDSYLSYPTANQPEEVYFCCSNWQAGDKGCGYEFSETVILRITLEEPNDE